jgi:RimJ/RimL family protein N-acetyltransferase
MVISLSDGTQVLVRHVQPADKHLIAKAWVLLSEESQRKRFLAPKPHLTGSDLRYLTHVDQLDHVALIAVRADNPGRVVGVGRFVRLADDPETAEAAITVADPMQGKGMGRHLGRLLAEEARRVGVKRFSASVLTDNQPALKLMRSMADCLDCLHTTTSHGVSDLVADLAA